MVQNQFCFHPVGQGLFYSGSLNCGEYNFVFDCGTENVKYYLEREIKFLATSIPQKSGNKKQTLDFVVISHWHIDHFKGLATLVKYFDIKNLYLPYINAPKGVIELLFAYSIFFAGGMSYADGNPLYKTMLRYYEYAMRNRELLDRNKSNAEETDRIDKENIWNVRFVQDNEPIFYDSCKLLCIEEQTIDIDSVKWAFVFVNKSYDNQTMNLFNTNINNEIEKCGYKFVADIVDKLKDPQEYKNAKTALAKAYNNTFGSGNPLNETSIVLMHYPVLQHKLLMVDTYSYFVTNRNKRYIVSSDGAIGDATLLTGDAVIDSVMQLKLVKNYGNLPRGILQVPHHGSWSNYTGGVSSNIPISLWKNFTLQLIPYGIGNKHNLPSRSTLTFIRNAGSTMLHATQNDGVIYSLRILHI